MELEPFGIIILVIDAFDKLNIPYFIGGSLASAIHGSARSTLDADMVADIDPKQVKALVEFFQTDFYIDEEMISDAIQNQSSFNIIHLASSFKVDVFIPKDRRYDRMQFQRRQREVVESDLQREVYVTTAEDIILAKLEWYRMGGEISDRQWRDILGVIKIQGGKLDIDYLKEWSAELGVSDLLQKALLEKNNYGH